MRALESGWADSAAAGSRPPCSPSPGHEPAAQLEAEVPEVLFEGLRQFLENHPEWTQHQVATSALATFLFQNGCKDTCVHQHYFGALFLR
ncbi:DUF2811 domain-containing protein [Cyanobium sp. NIES-981]|uniref:DUF2811 domain-containing protein n=1 Tax=Cyanobium sp. NIES-981 TaxID=1851505 RepID=UPI001CEC8FAB|nr:DUF2811 domain-containing protein [Cyanobium sp. NIES-981]